MRKYSKPRSPRAHSIPMVMIGTFIEMAAPGYIGLTDNLGSRELTGSQLAAGNVAPASGLKSVSGEDGQWWSSFLLCAFQEST